VKEAQLNGIVKRLCSHLTVMLFLGFCFASSTGCGERDTVLVIERPTEVYSIIQTSSAEDPNTNVQPGNVIATLKAGETARAVGVYHGQDHDGFKVKLANGAEGLIFASDSFRVTSR
jgi:hypothetical protein